MNKFLAVDIGKQFGSSFGGDLSTPGKGLGALISLILKGSFAISGILILFLIIFAGLSMLQGAGQNNPEAAKKGKEAATAALTGFIIVFVAYWIIRVIERIIGVNFITESGI